MIQGLHHIAIICSDFKKSKMFYMDVLGFQLLMEVYREDRKSYKLDLLHPSGLQVELFSFENPPARITNPEAAGLRHIAFKVANMDKAVNYLIGKGIKPEPIRMDEATGKRFLFFSDPDGLPIELYETEG